MLRYCVDVLWVHAKCSLLYSCVSMGGWRDGWYFTIFMLCFIDVSVLIAIVLTLLAASIQMAFCFSGSLLRASLLFCLIQLLFVANKFFFLLSSYLSFWFRVIILTACLDYHNSPFAMSQITVYV